MDIIIHGTKGGWDIFSTKKVSGLLDVTPDTVIGAPIGQEAFGIRFMDDNVIFSKYKIIRDVRGAKRIGFLAFSLLLSKGEKLSGTDIIALLEKISRDYCLEYIPENDNNLKDVRENWSFVDNILSEYKSKIRLNNQDDFESLQSGEKDDSYIYYNNDNELQKYFDNPYQEEYTEFRQVLFLRDNLEGKSENTLNALRHCDVNLTGKIDLENPKYKLIFNQQAKGGLIIDIKINGKTRFNKTKIRRKDELEITWSKQYHESNFKKGKWSEISPEYIFVDENSETISIKEIDLPINTKPVTITVKGKGEILGSDIEIVLKSGSERKIEKTDQIIFNGKEIEQQWFISARNGENFFSDEIQIIPDDTNQVELELKERKKLEIIAHEESIDGDVIKGVRINKSEFIDEEINQIHRITVSCNDYDSYSFDYYPRTDKSTQHKFLHKRKVVGYKIHSGEHGKISKNCPQFSQSSRGRDLPKHCIIPNNGYTFENWKLEDNTLIAQYKKKNFFTQPIGIAVSVVTLLILAISIVLWFLDFNKTDSSQIKEKQIVSYLDGIKLDSAELSNYKKSWEKQIPEIKMKGGTLLYNLFGIGENQGIPDSTQYYTWWKVAQSINTAITKRRLINDLDFEGLKDLNYSSSQQKFKNSIEGIDSINYELVRIGVLKNNVANITLDNIAVKIDSIVQRHKIINDTTGSISKEFKVELPPSNNNLNEKSTQNSIPISKEQDNFIDITQNLKSGDVTKDQLNIWKKDPNMTEYHNSINLYLEFWGTIKPGMQKDDSDILLKKIYSDKYLKESELHSFLKSVCENSTSFKNYNDTPGKIRCKTINDLKELL